MTKGTKTMRLLVVGVALVVTAGCEGLLDVESPGRIGDEDLGTPDAIPGMVTGMKYDLSQAYDGGLEIISIASTELYHGGSYDWGDIPRGVILDDDSTPWSSAQQARWVAEEGLRRMEEILEPAQFSSSPFVAEANVLGGYANRFLGENFCSSVIDGGPEIANTDHFPRADAEFTQALTIAQAAGNTDIVNAALAGRASVRAWQGDWAGAVADAALVPIDFAVYAEIDTELRNEVVYETHTRFEYTVWNTIFEAHPDDMRVPWDTVFNADLTIANTANGSNPMFQQQKYVNRSDDIALAKGTEMLLLRAEAALRDGDITGAYTLMNEARAFYTMPALAQAGTIEAAWADLHFERVATTWIEARALWDYRRWFAETGPGHNDTMNGRDACWPIPESEKEANPNLTP